MSSIMLKGKILGFEELESYELREIGNEGSPFRLLSSLEAELSFLVVNPFSIVEDYTFDISDPVARELKLGHGKADDAAVLCIVRLNDQTSDVNLRSPVVVNTRDGLFTQVVLENETYSPSARFIINELRD
jgi:flagellar assembly factor FliW